MKEKLVKLLKNLGWFLLFVGVAAISVRLVTIVKTLNSNEPMNPELLPETYADAVEQKKLAYVIDYFKRATDWLGREVASTKILITSDEMREEMDAFSDRVREMKSSIERLQGKKVLRDKEVGGLQRKYLDLENEFSEIQARIEKLQKETPATAAN